MLKLYKIHDCGEYFWYSAKDEEHALKLHIYIMQEDNGYDPSDCDKPVQVPDDKVMTIQETSDVPPYSLTKTAAEWAADGEGMVCSTLY